MERRKVLFTAGMTDDAVIIITDIPKEEIEDWCRRYNMEIENGVNTYLETLKARGYVKELHDSENDDNADIEVIGYDESYDLFDYMD